MARDSKATQALWRRRLQRFHKSGLSIRAFCRQEGVSEPSFYSWRKKLAQAPHTTRPAATPITPAFQPLHLTALAPVLAIELPSGTRLEVPAEHLRLAPSGAKTLSAKNSDRTVSCDEATQNKLSLESPEME